MARSVWLEDSGSSSGLQKVCFHSRAAHIQLGPAVHVGHGLCDARAYILVWQTHLVYPTLGMANSQAGRHSGRQARSAFPGFPDGREI